MDQNELKTFHSNGKPVASHSISSNQLVIFIPFGYQMWSLPFPLLLLLFETLKFCIKIIHYADQSKQKPTNHFSIDLKICYTFTLRVFIGWRCTVWRESIEYHLNRKKAILLASSFSYLKMTLTFNLCFVLIATNSDFAFVWFLQCLLTVPIEA